MRKRSRADRAEALVRAASERNLGLVAAVLIASLVFIGSPARSYQPVEAGKGLGGASASVIGLAATGGTAIAAPVSGAVPDAAALAGEPAGTGPVAEDRGIYYTAYAIKAGDTVGDIAAAFDTSVDGVISFNNIQNTRALRVGQILKVPSMAGILVTAKEGDTVASLAATYEVDADRIIEANGLLSESLLADHIVFLPDAQLPSYQLREIDHGLQE